MNIVKILKAAICTLILSTTLGCGLTEKDDKNKGIMVEDFRVENYFRMGTNRQVYTDVPQRVITIGAAQTEAVLDLGAEDAILYAVKYEDSKQFPIKSVNQNVFNTLNFLPRNKINIESMLALNPDLIISEESWYAKNKLGSTDYWNQHGVHTMITPSTTSPFKLNEPETLQGEMEFILKLGKVFHKESRAQQIVNETMNRIQIINHARAGKDKPKVLILDLLSTKVSYGSNKIAGSMVESIGGSVPYTTATVSDEYILQEDPDIIFVVSYDNDQKVIEKITSKAQFKNTKFVKNNRIYPIPLKYVYGPLTRVIDSIGYMANSMYPNEFNFEKEFEFK